MSCQKYNGTDNAVIYSFDRNLYDLPPEQISERMMNEKDPYIREMFFMGIEIIYEDITMNQLVLIKRGDKTEYRINLYDFMQFILSLKVITARLYSGEVHRWISEADGSCERFKKYIQQKINNK